MSINSMTNIALRRRTDRPGNVPADPDTGTAIANAADSESSTGQSPVTVALAIIVSYIPTEVLTLYVATLAVFVDPQSPSSNMVWGIFTAFLIASPIIVWLVYAAKVRSVGKPLPVHPRTWPLWEMAAGTIAYVAWAASLPDAVILDSLELPSALAAVIVLVTSAALGLLAPLFQHEIVAN